MEAENESGFQLAIGMRDIKLAFTAIFISIVLMNSYPAYVFLKKVWIQRKFLRDNFQHLPIDYFLGNVRQIPTKLAGDSISEFFVGIVDKFPRTYSFFMGPVLQDVTVVHPETVKVILKTSEPKNITNGPYKFLRDWLGDGLLMSSGKKHLRNRRLLTPAFHFEILKPYMAIYNRAATTLTENLKSASNNGENSVEIYGPVGLCTLDVILKCAFSYTDEVQLIGERHPYVTSVLNISKRIMWRVMSVYLHWDTLFYASPTGRSFIKSRDHVWKVAREIIAKRKSSLKDSSGGCSSKRYKDFLDILLLARDETGDGLTEEEIRQEVDTFLFEGHDTTASAISWCLHAFAEHPNEQARARAEVDELMSKKQNSDIEWDDLQNLQYLQMCIKESLRRTPPVLYIMRELTQSLELDGVTVPAETSVAINIYGLHHNRTVWGDDHRDFKPERFSQENMKTMDSHAFIGFSAGPRNCIGQNFAMHELKVIIAKVLYSFELSLDPGHKAEVSFELVMRSSNGIKLFLKPRQH